MLVTPARKRLQDLIDVLGQLNDDEFTFRFAELGNSTIGEHSRHVIEMFQCLVNGYDTSVVNYERRTRDLQLQTNLRFAIQTLQRISDDIEMPDKPLAVSYISSAEGELMIQSNFYRELLYNLEHCIHHQALIKVGLRHFENVSVSADFGIAASTIEYRSQCAQ